MFDLNKVEIQNSKVVDLLKFIKGKITGLALKS